LNKTADLNLTDPISSHSFGPSELWASLEKVPMVETRIIIRAFSQVSVVVFTFSSGID
jgi:hypothetical protein